MNLSFLAVSLIRIIAYGTLITILVSCGSVKTKRKPTKPKPPALEQRIIGELLRIEKKFQLYFTVNGKYPLNNETRSSLPVDPWGEKYKINILRNITGIKIYSLGSDRAPGGRHDKKDMHIYVVPDDEHQFASLVFAIAEDLGKTVAITAYTNKQGNKSIKHSQSWLSNKRLIFDNAKFKTVTYQNLTILHHESENIKQLLNLAQSNNRLVYNVYTDDEMSKKRLVVVGHFPSKLFLKVVQMYCQENYRISFDKSDEFIIHAPNWWQESLCYYFPIILAINNIKLHLNQGKIFGQHVKN